MEELYQIYLITNIVNSKRYVGQVVQHRGYISRFKEHLNGTKYANTRKLSNAIKKYGKDNFIVELIEENIPESAIDIKEQYYISYYDTFSVNGYNMTIGGQGVHGYKHTDEDKEKISEKSKEFWNKLRNDPDKLNQRNQKISEKLSGIQRSDETRELQSQIAKERFSKEHGTFLGKKHTTETKQKIAEKNGHQIGMYDKDTNNLIRTFVSSMEASRYLNEQGITNNKSAFTRIITICDQIKGQGKTAYGYIWRYLQ